MKRITTNAIDFLFFHDKTLSHLSLYDFGLAFERSKVNNQKSSTTARMGSR
jgi:hypothetical protein